MAKLNFKYSTMNAGKSLDLIRTVYNYEELIEVLKGLGYKQSDINKVLPSIKSDLNIEDQVKEALKLLLK
jgi:thymidine kinase